MEDHALFQEKLAGCIESTRLGYQRLFLENQLFHYGIQHPCLSNEVFHCKSFWSSTKLYSFVNKDLRSRCWGWTGEKGSLISFRLLALWLSPFHSEVCCTNLCFYRLLFLNHFYLLMVSRHPVTHVLCKTQQGLLRLLSRCTACHAGLGSWKPC